VYRLLEEMPYDEMMSWLDYFELRPFGWRDDLRTARILQANGFKGDITKLFPTLKTKTPENPTDSFVGSLFHNMLKNAVGGEKIV